MGIEAQTATTVLDFSGTDLHRNLLESLGMGQVERLALGLLTVRAHQHHLAGDAAKHQGVGEHHPDFAGPHDSDFHIKFFRHGRPAFKISRLLVRISR
jgi:hypothetical protein